MVVERRDRRSRRLSRGVFTRIRGRRREVARFLKFSDATLGSRRQLARYVEAVAVDLDDLGIRINRLAAVATRPGAGVFPDYGSGWPEGRLSAASADHRVSADRRERAAQGLMMCCHLCEPVALWGRDRGSVAQTHVTGSRGPRYCFWDG